MHYLTLLGYLLGPQCSTPTIPYPYRLYSYPPQCISQDPGRKQEHVCKELFTKVPEKLNGQTKEGESTQISAGAGNSTRTQIKEMVVPLSPRSWSL